MKEKFFTYAELSKAPAGVYRFCHSTGERGFDAESIIVLRDGTLRKQSHERHYKIDVAFDNFKFLRATPEDEKARLHRLGITLTPAGRHGPRRRLLG